MSLYSTFRLWRHHSVSSRPSSPLLSSTRLIMGPGKESTERKPSKATVIQVTSSKITSLSSELLSHHFNFVAVTSSEISVIWIWRYHTVIFPGSGREQTVHALLHRQSGIGWRGGCDVTHDHLSSGFFEIKRECSRKFRILYNRRWWLTRN